MSAELVYFLYGALILAIGVPAYWWLNPALAFVITFVAPPALFQLGNWLYLGYLDPFWGIAAFITGLISFIASLIVGQAVWIAKSALSGVHDRDEI